MTPINIPTNSTIVEFIKSTKVFNESCIVIGMMKFSAEESYKRMAEFVKDSGVTDTRKITQKIADASDVSFEAVNKWKEGRTKSITMPPINNFCEKYGANPSYISAGQLPRTRGDTAPPELEEVLKLFPNASAERQKVVLEILRSESAKEI